MRNKEECVPTYKQHEHFGFALRELLIYMKKLYNGHKKACVLKTNIHKLLEVYSRALGLQLKWYLDFLSTQLLIWTLDPYKGPFIICLHVAFSLCKNHVLFRSVLYFITSRTLVKHRWSKRMTAI